MAPLAGSRKRKRSAMNMFRDERRVRLRSRGRDGLFLRAGEDGVGVHLGPQLPDPLQAEWLVHRIEREGDTLLLLHGAAYGRYLAATDDPAPRGHIGKRVVQDVFNKYGEVAVSWKPRWVSEDSDHVYLRHLGTNRYLRANGKYCWWRTGVSVCEGSEDSMIQWVVEQVPARSPELPPPTTTVAPRRALWSMLLGHSTPEEERRTVRVLRATGDGSEDIQFHGRSVYNLRSVVAEHLKENSPDTIKMCVRAGKMGRLTPLLTDLPSSKDVFELFVSSGADLAIEHPDNCRLEQSILQPELVADQPCSNEDPSNSLERPTALSIHLGLPSLSTKTPESFLPPPVTTVEVQASHARQMASSRPRLLDPDVVYDYFINGKADELLNYLCAIPGALRDPECRLIKEAAQKLRKLGLALVGEPESVTKRRHVLAQTAEKDERRSRLSRHLHSPFQLASDKYLILDEAKDKLLVTQNTLRGIEADIDQGQDKVHRFEQRIRNGELSQEEKAKLIPEMKEKKGKMKRFRGNLVLDEQS